MTFLKSPYSLTHPVLFYYIGVSGNKVLQNLDIKNFKLLFRRTWVFCDITFYLFLYKLKTLIMLYSICVNLKQKPFCNVIFAFSQAAHYIIHKNRLTRQLFPTVSFDTKQLIYHV
jgi:hypothetical protein